MDAAGIPGVPAGAGAARAADPPGGDIRNLLSRVDRMLAGWTARPKRAVTAVRRPRRQGQSRPAATASAKRSAGHTSMPSLDTNAPRPA